MCSAADSPEGCLTPLLPLRAQCCVRPGSTRSDSNLFKLRYFPQQGGLDVEYKTSIDGVPQLHKVALGGETSIEVSSGDSVGQRRFTEAHVVRLPNRRSTSWIIHNKNDYLHCIMPLNRQIRVCR